MCGLVLVLPAMLREHHEYCVRSAPGIYLACSWKRVARVARGRWQQDMAKRLSGGGIQACDTGHHRGAAQPCESWHLPPLSGVSGARLYL